MQTVRGTQMSATNRGSKRQERDFYSTPSWCVEAILPYLTPWETACDPCAGTGAILKVLPDDREVWGLEIDPTRAEQSGSFCLSERPQFGRSVKCQDRACSFQEFYPLDDDSWPREHCGYKAKTSTSDANEYAWFVWGQGRGGRWCVL